MTSPTDAELPGRTSVLSRGTTIAIVVGIFVAILLGALDQFVVLTALPKIAEQLGQPTGVTFVVSAYLISATIGIPVFGRLADIRGRRTVILIGLATFLTGSALAGFSRTLDELIAFRALQGFSSGAFIIVGFAIVGALFPPNARARIAGLFSGSFVIATILGPLVGSYIIDHASWPWVFFLNLPIAGTTAVLLAFRLPPLVPERPGRFDVPGAALLAGWVGSLTLPLVETSDGSWSWTSLWVVGLVVTAGVLFVGFVLWELRTDSPILPLRHFARRTFAASGAAALFRGAVLSAELAFLAVFVGLVLLRGGAGSADSVRSVLYWLLVPGVLGAGIGSQLVTRLGYRSVTAPGLAIALAGTVLLTALAGSSTVAQYQWGFLPTGGLVLALPLIGFGVGLSIPVTLLAAQFALPEREVGSATAMIQFLGTLGGALAVSLLAAFQQGRLSSRLAALTPASCAGSSLGGGNCASSVAAVHGALVGSFQDTFGVIAGLMAVAFAASLMLKGRLPTPARADISSGQRALGHPNSPSATTDLVP
ncbi:MAG: MFS transporter [Thermoplasmata archaeon]|nr:MFS transporter [Thermoplasmata archaeon]